MTRDDDYLLSLLSSAVNNKAPIPPSYESVDWTYIYEQSIHHNISPLIYVVVKDLPADLQPPFLKQWKMQTLYSSTKSIQRRNELLELFDEFKAADIEVLLFKGLIISELYPEPILRNSGDVDLLVRIENLEKITELLVNIGYKRSKENTDLKYTYFISPDGLVVDLQTKVWSYYANKDKKKSELIEEMIWQNHIIALVDGHEIPTLGIQEHLFGLICHAAKHFISQGIGIRHLCDIALYVNKYYENIDWPSLVPKFEKINLLGFFESLLVLNERYLGMKKLPVIISNALNQDAQDMLLKDMLDAGIFGRKSLANKIMIPAVGSVYYLGKSSQRMKLLLHLLFPSSKGFGQRYNYAKKYPILLPAAWIHRGIHNLSRLNKATDGLEILTSMNLSTERIQLLDQLGIL